MMSLWLLLILFLACGVVVYAYQRLQGVSTRLKDLHEDLARNDEQLRRHLTRLQAIEEASRQEASSFAEDDAAQNETKISKSTDDKE